MRDGVSEISNAGQYLLSKYVGFGKQWKNFYLSWLVLIRWTRSSCWMWMYSWKAHLGNFGAGEWEKQAPIMTNPVAFHPENLSKKLYMHRAF